MMDKVAFFKNISFLAHLSDDTLQEIADVIEQKLYNKHDIIFREGEPSDGMYIILFGEVEVAIGNKLIAKLGIGDFFGEISLIKSSPRSGSVGVVSPNCSALFLSKVAFDKIKYKVNPQGQKEILRRIHENKQKFNK